MTTDKLKEVSDILEIQKLKAIYCEVADLGTSEPAKATQRFKDIFIADVKGDYGVMLDGCDAVSKFIVVDICGTLNWMWHAIHTPQIEVKGDTATGSWTIVARKQTKGSTGQEMLFGRYVDEFRRTPSGWRISAVRWIEVGQTS